MLAPQARRRHMWVLDVVQPVGTDAAKAYGLAAEMAKGFGHPGVIEESEGLSGRPRFPPVRHKGRRQSANAFTNSDGHRGGYLKPPLLRKKLPRTRAGW